MSSLDLRTTLTTPMTDPAWIVQGILPQGVFAILAGEAGSGKTIVCYHLSLCVATGLPFLGQYPTTPTRILYVDEEQSLPDAERYWQRAYLGLGSPDLEAIVTQLRVERFSLGLHWSSTLRSLVKAWHPGLVIIDTATPALQIKDENDNAEASRKIQLLRAIQQDYAPLTFLVLKHEKTRDDASHRRTVRGAKTWLGQVDIVMYHSFGRGGSGTLRHTYLEADKPRAFGLDHIIEIIPSWTATEEPRGYRLLSKRREPTP